jgi:hypothetical protein
MTNRTATVTHSSDGVQHRPSGDPRPVGEGDRRRGGDEEEGDSPVVRPAYLSRMPNWSEMEPVLRTAYWLLDESADGKVNGAALADALGRDHDDPHLWFVLREAKKYGWIEAAFPSGRYLKLVRATEKGLQRFSGWPRPGDVDVDALVQVLTERIEDPATPADDRTALVKVRDGLVEMGKSAATSIVTAWITRATGLDGT